MVGVDAEVIILHCLAYVKHAQFFDLIEVLFIFALIYLLLGYGKVCLKYIVGCDEVELKFE